jgi:hypothetical protein
LYLFLDRGWLSRRAGAIGLDHHQAGIVEQLLRFDLRLLVARFFTPGLLMARFLVAGLLVPGLLVPLLFVARLFMARLRVHRLGMLRFRVVRFLLALGLQLVNPALGFDYGRIDVRRGLLASSVAVAIASATASATAPRLVAVALRTRMLGTRIAGVRARVLDRGLGLALG